MEFLKPKYLSKNLLLNRAPEPLGTALANKPCFWKHGRQLLLESLPAFAFSSWWGTTRFQRLAFVIEALTALFLHMQLNNWQTDNMQAQD